MPFTPHLEEHKEGDPVDLTKGAPYPSLSLIGKTAANSVEHIQYKNLVNNLPFGNLNRLRLPNEGPEPVITQEDIDEWKQDRPDLPNIPIGLPKYVGEATVSMYDDDKNLGRMKQIDPGMLTKIGMFGGSFGASLLDPVNLAGGFGVAGLAEKGALAIGKTTIAKNTLERMASSEIFGSGAARTATQVAQSGGKFAAFNVGSQISEEAAQIQVDKTLERPHDYIQSLQNIGYSGLEGLLLGSLFGGAGRILLGERVKISEPTTKPGAKGPQMQLPESTVEVPAQYERRGGLLNRPELQNIPQQTKELIGKVYRPWSRDANTTMTEEAVGQMANGQTVDVGLIMKQGMVEEGENFRAAMRDSGVNVEVLDGALSDAHANLRSEMAETSQQLTELGRAERTLLAGEAVGIKENKAFSQEGIFKRFKQAQFNENLVENAPTTIPENVRKHMEIQKQIDKLQEKLETEKGRMPSVTKINSALGDADVVREPAAPNKKVVRRIKQLKSRQPKILTPKQELKQLKNDLLTNGTQGEPYARLSELAQVWQQAKRLKDYIDLRQAAESTFKEQNAHNIVIQSMRDHINDSHEPVSNSEVKEYSDRLRSPGIPETPPIAEPRESHEGWDIDNYLEQYSPEEVKSLSEQIGDKSVMEQLERNQKRLNKIERYRDMAAKMADCLLKGTL
jgi:hypothetical protein